MNFHEITADIYSDSGAGAYRVYVDDDLITERTWCWPSHEVFVREHVVVELAPGEHQLRIETCCGSGEFEVRSLTIDGVVMADGDLSFAIAS